MSHRLANAARPSTLNRDDVFSQVDMSVKVLKRSGVLYEVICWYPQFLPCTLSHAQPFRLSLPQTSILMKTSCNGALTSQASDLTSRESYAPESTTGEDT